MKFVLKADQEDTKKEPTQTEYEEVLSNQAQRSDFARRVRTLENFISNMKETEASSGTMAIIKAYLKSTQGMGEIGDRFPLTEDNIQAFEEACDFYEYCKRSFGEDHEYTEQLGDKIIIAYADHFGRSLRREHTNYRFIAPPDTRQNQFGFGKKTDSLEK